jgi:hypothetical protein
MRPYVEAHLSIKQAIFVIISVTCCTVAVVVGAYTFQMMRQVEKAKSPKYAVLGIIQKSASQDMLKTDQLAAFLGLSSDVPQNLYAFDMGLARRKLLSLPFMKKVSIQRIEPNLLSIEYELRTPKWLLADYENVAIDQDGYLFPITPFFSPKSLPQIFLGLPAFQGEPDLQGRRGGTWNQALQGKHMALVRDIFELEKTFHPHFEMVSVDVQKTFCASKNCEIVLRLKEKKIQGIQDVHICEYLLRLPQEGYKEAITRFFEHKASFEPLRKKEHLLIVDLRLDRIALVKSCELPVK